MLVYYVFLLQLETKTRFLTVEYCTVFQAVFTSTVIANGTQRVEYNATLVTEHNPDADFDLEEFRVEVTAGDGEGHATAVWRHTHQCLQKYMVRVDKPDGTKGENFVQLPQQHGQEVRGVLST